MSKYAIIESGGKQYTVQPGSTIKVEKLGVPVGVNFDFDNVLLVKDGDKVFTGSPNVQGAKVVGFVDGDGKAKKITVFKFKAKNRYRVKNGHRQPYSEVTIKDIQTP